MDLFIGGCADGQRIDVGDVGETFSVPHEMRSTELDYKNSNYVEKFMKTDIYRRAKLYDGDKKYNVWMYDKDQDLGVIEALIHGYSGMP